MGAESSVPRDGRSQEDKSQEDARVSASASGRELTAEGSVLQERSRVTDSEPLAKNGQISSMTSLNGPSEDDTLAEVGQPDGVIQKDEAPETMDSLQGEVAPQVNGEKAEKESPDAISAAEEKAAEEKPGDANEVGFKKIFRFVGFKFTLKKDKSEEKEPVKLLTVKDKEEEVSGTDEPTKEQEEEKSPAQEKEADTDAAEVLQEEEAEASAAPTEDAEATEKEGEVVLSPFRKLFSTGLFSNLRKKASVKKTKEEEDKEPAVEEEATKTEEADAVEEKEEKDEEANEEAPAAPEEEKTETSPEAAEDTTDDTKQEEEKPEAEVTSEAELLSSQEKVKSQGSPLKKLFTGAGLKKLSTKKQRAKREKKLTESGEQAGEQLLSSTESGDAPKTDSGPTSPEESVEVTQTESSQETDGEVAPDGEKKRDGIIAWSSFKKLVTPKKLVKRSSESEDEATGEKAAKSATLSSSESAPLADTSVEEEAQEDKPTEEEPKTENTEKLVSSTEEPKRKMDTSVSWEALMCMGGPKKRTRKTSDSDDEETKVEEEPAAEAAAEGAEPEVEGAEPEVEAEAAIVTSQNSESDAEVASSPEPSCPAPERESTWDTLKRMVMPKNKAKVEEKPEETADQVLSDSEAPKDESSFSLRKLFPGRRKKKAEKQASTEQGEEDSDTPAVVPLSEYEDQVEAEQEAQEEEAPAEPTEVQIIVTAEDRSPSWIAAAVEEGDEQHDQLSDIPEEAENAATPKSVDTDIVEEEDKESSPKPPRRTGRRLSTAEVMPFAPAPSAETTPVPQGPNANSAVAVLEGVMAQVTEIAPQVDVTVEDVLTEEASEKTEFEPPIEKVESSTCTILQPHASDEAMAICTGLGTMEIAKVAMEKPAMPIAECVAVIHDSVSTEMAEMQKPPCAEEAIDSGDAILIAQVHQVEATELEPMVESPTDSSDLQAASVSLEPGLDQVGIVSVQESEIIQPASLSENSLKTFVVDPITPTSETAVCTQSVEVTEPTVETKEIQLDVEQLAATEENTAKEVVQSVTQEIAATICERAETSIPETEQAINLIVPSEEVVIAETLVLVAPANEDASEIENAAETVVEKVEEIIEQTSEIEVQSMVIAQNAIQDAVDKVSEDKPESEDPDTPAPVTAIATTEQEMEISTESPVVTETPVAVECKAPKSPKLLHVAMEVTDTTILEVTGSLDASVEEKTPEEELKEDVEVKVSEETIVLEEVFEIKSEIQMEEELEEVKEEEAEVKEPEVKEEAEVKAPEVNEEAEVKEPEVNEEAEVTEPEVNEEAEVKEPEVNEEAEVKEPEVNEEAEVKEPEVNEEAEVKAPEVNEEAEVKAPEVEEKAEEVEPQSEEGKSDSPSEENQENVLEIHMPVQVVLQTAQVFEDPSVEEEAAVEFDSDGPVAEEPSVKPKKAAKENKLSTLSEEPQVPAEVSTPSRDAETPGAAPSGKCAQVMAQVMEVIEEAVKEIEPVSTEITAAS